jgi:hypothetical protein
MLQQLIRPSCSQQQQQSVTAASSSSSPRSPSHVVRTVVTVAAAATVRIVIMSSDISSSSSGIPRFSGREENWLMWRAEIIGYFVAHDLMCVIEGGEMKYRAEAVATSGGACNSVRVRQASTRRL